MTSHEDGPKKFSRFAGHGGELAILGLLCGFQAGHVHSKGGQEQTLSFSEKLKRNVIRKNLNRRDAVFLI